MIAQYFCLCTSKQAAPQCASVSYWSRFCFRFRGPGGRALILLSAGSHTSCPCCLCPVQVHINVQLRYIDSCEEHLLLLCCDCVNHKKMGLGIGTIIGYNSFLCSCRHARKNGNEKHFSVSWTLSIMQSLYLQVIKCTSLW